MTPLAIAACVALLAPSAPDSPVADGAVLSPLAQWRAVEACPLILTGGERARATAVVVGQKGNTVYLLTAHHATAEIANRDFHFFTDTSYPLPAWKVEKATVAVAAGSKSADFALLRMVVPERRWDDPGTPKEFKRPIPIPRLKLAAPGERPKAFPFDALSVGCSGGAPPTCLKETIRAKRLVRPPANEARELADRVSLGGAFYWQTAAPPERGRSGGPLLNRDGKIIGLCAANQDGLGYYTHLDEILAELKEKKLDWLWEDD